MRATKALFLFLLTPLFAVAATPVVNSGTINYSTNQITLIGSGFEPAKAKPTVAFNGSALTVATFSNTQVTATLPTGLTPGTFDLTVTNSQGNSVTFDMTYGATGPQGPAGPAGPTGAQGPAGLAGATGATGASGPRGLTGAPGAPGPAGSNGVSFTFLDAYNPYATYAADSVVTYNGSSYIAIVANGPNPTGPTPDQNPSWSLMAAAGAAGAAGPAGAVGPPGPAGQQGSTGLMGNPGPAGPAGPAGPQGPTGGVLSFTGNKETSSIRLLDEIDEQGGNVVTTNSITLANTGTYVLIGAQLIQNKDTTYSAYAICYALDSANNPILTTASGDVGPENGGGSYVTLPLAGYYTVTTAPVTVSVKCYFAGNALSGSDLEAQPGSVLTAIQVQ
jgi:collagen triple helix repeat protein/IPT/TIG domain-containing protein